MARNRPKPIKPSIPNPLALPRGTHGQSPDRRAIPADNVLRTAPAIVAATEWLERTGIDADRAAEIAAVLAADPAQGQRGSLEPVYGHEERDGDADAAFADYWAEREVLDAAPAGPGGPNLRRADHSAPDRHASWAEAAAFNVALMSHWGSEPLHGTTWCRRSILNVTAFERRNRRLRDDYTQGPSGPCLPITRYGERSRMAEIIGTIRADVRERAKARARAAWEARRATAPQRQAKAEARRARRLAMFRRGGL